MCEPIKFSDKVYEVELVHVKPEFYLDYKCAMKKFMEHHPEFPVVAVWEVDQGGALCYAIMKEYPSHKKRCEIKKKFKEDPRFEYFLARIGRMVNSVSLKTFRALPGYELRCPSKPAYFEAVRYEFHDPRPHKWAPHWCELQKAANKYLEKHGGGVVGAFACEFGNPTGGLLYIVHYPGGDVHKQCFEEIMCDKNIQEKMDCMAKHLKHLENTGLLACEGVGCFK